MAVLYAFRSSEAPPKSFSLKGKHREIELAENNDFYARILLTLFHLFFISPNVKENSSAFVFVFSSNIFLLPLIISLLLAIYYKRMPTKML